MNRRGLLGGFLVIVCLAILWGVAGQRGQLASLRAEQQRLLAQMAVRADDSTSPRTAGAGGPGSGTPAPTLVVAPELLRLRNEVTRLTERRRELAGVLAENERLRAQVAARGSNGLGGYQLPPGYMLKSQARMVGYNTPDDTLQSMLWAIQNHDLTNMLQALTPELAEKAQAELARSNRPIEELLGQGTTFPGIGIVGREQFTNDGATILRVEYVPGLHGTEVLFRQINGQWKIAGPF